MVLAIDWLGPKLGPRLFAPPTYDYFGEWFYLFKPEPVEEARFMIAIAIPVVLAAAVLLFGSARAPNRRWDPAIIAGQLAGLGVVIWAATKQTRDGWLHLIQFQPLLVSVPNLIAAGVIGVVLTAILLRNRLPSWGWARSIAERVRDRPAIPLAIAIVLTVVWVFPALLTDSTVQDAGTIPPGHTPYQLEDYVAVINGRTPLVDFVPDYASLIPLATAPILGLFDSSITTFSIIECVLTLIGLIAVYAAFVQITQRPWPALGLYLPFMALSLFPWIEDGPARDFNANYYALMPNRLLGPFVVIWLLARHLRRGSPPLWVAFFAAGLTVLNNFEFGACCFAALVVAVVIAADRATFWERLPALIAQAAAGLVGALALVSAVTLIRAGELPDLGILTYWSRIFGRSGYGLLPMNTWGLHWALYATYAGTLGLAAVRWVRAEPDRTLTGMLTFAGILGLTTGQYFAGRSDPAQLLTLFPTWAFALALLAWVTVPWLREARLDRARLRRNFVAAFAVMLGFGLMVSALGRFPPPWRQVDRLSDSGTPIYDLSEAQRFVESRTDPGEKILLIGTPLDHRVAERAGVENVSPWGGGGSALISAQELNRAINNLKDEDGSKLFEGSDLPSVQLLLPQLGFVKVTSDSATGLNEWHLR